MVLAELQRRAQALVGVRRRHADVEHADVRAVLLDRLQQRLGVRHGGDDLEPAVVQQPLQAGAQEQRVLGDQDAHGSSARTMVGPPDGLQTVRRPSTAVARSARPRSPLPLASAPPAPSSSISITSRSS